MFLTLKSCFMFSGETLNQVQGDTEQTVMLNLFQHRKIEVNNPNLTAGNLIFKPPATLKQVQGDEK